MKNFLVNLYFPFRIFTALALGFLSGILLASNINFEFLQSKYTFLSLVVVFLLCCLVNFLLKNRFLVLISFFLLFVSSGVIYYSFFEYANKTDLPYNEEKVIEGRIVKRPEIDWKSQKVVIKTSGISSNFAKKSTFLLVTLPRFPEYHFGETIRIEGKILEPQNFGDFDYKSYLKRYLISGTIKPEKAIFLKENTGVLWKAKEYLFLFSQYLEQSLNRILPEPHASLASGILLGAKRNMPEEFKEALKTVGLTHIVALSGFNITIIIAIFAESIVGFVGRRRTLWLGLSFVALFVVMTGGQPSAVRAAIFSVLVLLGKTIGRQADQTNLMLTAALIMVLVNPYVLFFDVGFELSFLAFAGLIYLSGPIFALIEKFKSKRWNSWFKKTLAETLGAQMAVMPLIWAKFGTVSLISPLANILVVWMVPLAMLFSFLSALAGAIYYPLGITTAALSWPTLQYVIKITEWLSKIPFASLNS